MKVVIQLTEKEQLKALPILHRHSPGTVLPGGIYIVEDLAAAALSQAGVKYTEVSRQGDAPLTKGVVGERV